VINKKSKEITKNLYSLPEFNRAKTIFIYLAFNKEVKTQPIINDLLIQGEKRAHSQPK